jgi:hypothetical protein
MSMKLPIILSAMIAALAVPNVLASQDGSEPTADKAPVDTAASEAGDTKKPTKKKRGHGKKRHKGAHHHSDNSSNTPTDPYKKAYDQGVPEADGDANRDLSPSAGVSVQPGQKTN